MASGATLRIDAADRPAAGGVFSSTLSNFDETWDALDLKALAFVSGATATLKGSTLVVSNGGHVYDFSLAGTGATAYGAKSDDSGGTLVRPTTASQIVFAQAMAALAPEPAAAHETAWSAHDRRDGLPAAVRSRMRVS